MNCECGQARICMIEKLTHYEYGPIVQAWCMCFNCGAFISLDWR